MIRHIVLFKLKDFSSDSERERALENMLVTFRSLVGQIPQIREFRVEADCVRGASSWDVIIDSRFDSAEDLKAYQAHPAHVDAVTAAARWFELKAVGDYEMANRT